MPKATAVWLLDNTALTFQQIADFCHLHYLEVETLANQEVTTIIGLDPIINGQLTQEEIDRCTSDKDARLQLQKNLSVGLSNKKSKYTPIARRQDKPNAIAWLIKHYPTMRDGYIVKLIGTTKNTIEAIRTKTHWNIQNIKPQSPVLLDLCSQGSLDKYVEKTQKEAAQST
tara:strand:+ start:29754 stop:30266 length:513 start_codon:yes stop_codon:yes gene_type:complete